MLRSSKDRNYPYEFHYPYSSSGRPLCPGELAEHSFRSLSHLPPLRCARQRQRHAGQGTGLGSTLFPLRVRRRIPLNGHAHENWSVIHYSSRGELVPDEICIELWKESITSAVEANRFKPELDVLLLDGIPRSV